jgi:DNA-3-methyladenine glycosylase I
VPIQNRLGSMAEVQAATDISTAMSKQLKKDGFNFCGPTIVYAFMQACGLVNDHLTTCPRHAAVAGMKRSN